jgi:hypothetical protein
MEKKLVQIRKRKKNNNSPRNFRRGIAGFSATALAPEESRLEDQSHRPDWSDQEACWKGRCSSSQGEYEDERNFLHTCLQRQRGKKKRTTGNNVHGLLNKNLQFGKGIIINSEFAGNDSFIERVNRENSMLITMRKCQYKVKAQGQEDNS